MKKRSVLIRRAALFTATVMAVTVAVSLCGYGIATYLLSRAAAKNQTELQLEYLVGLAREDDPDEWQDAAGVVGACGGVVWLQDLDWDVRCLTGDDAFPGIADDIDNSVRQPAQGYFRRDGRTWYYQDELIHEDVNVYQGRVAVAMLVQWKPDPLSFVPIALIAALMGLVGARLVIRRQKKADALIKAKEQAIVQLRDAAVAMADGHLETRADANAEGELGELGKALNHLADQLSRNLYTLIVERNRLRNMLNGLSEGIVAIDAEGRVTHTNPALGRLVPRGNKLHYPDPRMKTIPDETIWADFDKVMETGEPLTRNLESKDTILRMTVTPIVDEIDATAGAVGLFSDITQMERLERTRREYVSNVNHELRTPLTAMRALIEPLKEGMVTDEADRQRYYDIILREIMRLSRLINDQLELSRLQSGTLSIEKTTMKIDDLVYDVCDRYSIIAREHGLKLRVNTDFTECPAVYTNADRLEQMLILLLDNAIKYTEKGSVSLSARWDDEKVVISVNDTGIGIAKEDLPYVFDRFYKVDKAHSGKGSGLGLSIAKELLKRMDEEIRVTSEKGKGTQFSFTVHRYPPEEKRTA